jgi:cation diffusion facilitator family transporter
MGEFMQENVDRDKQIRRVIFIEGSANFFILLVKTLVGFSTGSMAILGDAIHSLTDVANNVVAWFIAKISSQPADREHPYGHQKFETLAVLGLAALLTALAFELALHAIRREQTEIATDPIALGLMFIVLITNIGIAAWERAWAKKLNSDLLLADAAHTFADSLTTVVVIVGWQLSAMGYPLLDTICALGVAGLVLYLAFGLFKKAIPVLVDSIAIEPEEIIQVVKDVSGLRKVDRVRSRWVGSARAVDMIVYVDPHLNISESHAIADEIEKLLEEKLSIHDVSIHIEPHSAGD